MLEEIRATRYVTPLREGGSLPGVMEADDLGTYVVKFRGAGQGRRVLVAEIISAELARRLGFRTPELKVIDVDPQLGAREPDEEIQDLLKASAGTIWRSTSCPPHSASTRSPGPPTPTSPPGCSGSTR